MAHPADEELVVHGRRFVLTIDGPDELRRFSAYLRDAATGEPLTRNPVRGRSADDARERALAVLHNLLTIDRIQEEVIAVAAALAPGASVELTEDARAIRADLAGPWRLTVPFEVPRDEVEDPDADWTDLPARVEAHFRRHLRPAGG